MKNVEKVVSVKTNETQTNSCEVGHQFTMTGPALPSGILMRESNMEQDEEGNHYQNREMTLLKEAIHISEGKYVKATRKLVKTEEKKKNAKNTVIRKSHIKKCDKQQKKVGEKVKKLKYMEFSEELLPNDLNFQEEVKLSNRQERDSNLMDIQPSLLDENSIHGQFYNPADYNYQLGNSDIVDSIYLDEQK
ncbi:hypothetical protein JTB14_023607 [Gonioctena quinquepunctata]|nr:hypothetical protein JTB14_023607 [Gonioctena quinquepunctata]